ncbi:MmcQ/YjbR family DNA-binding protein [Paenibacillus aurantius]|uniref:MmcQ/YjbR family DNA-binding protein n=1 Tax=Paenibacillus aurantius TaxID=2918900 RepID=A0AA96RG78_9BACL|nr:MmcQ/YjbR family DNA-binding protein [Paenibacillus aurantius]WNQ12777.1 MmcQ/YjbR family DNA-binding protein [Paenibacillus aurantius]
MSKALIRYCLSKKGAVEDRPFGPEPLVVKVGGRMFALIAESAEACHFSLKCDPVIAENLREQHSAVRPGYHLNKKHWNTVVLDGSLPEEDVMAMIDHSYDLVVAKLPRSVREELAG